MKKEKLVLPKRLGRLVFRITLKPVRGDGRIIGSFMEKQERGIRNRENGPTGNSGDL
jgi:hypothetical protein